MSLIPHHTSDPVCALCEEKLKLAHPELAKWFRDVKSRHPDVHVSWSYRDQASQQEAFEEGKSKLQFPMSAHNKTPTLALDIFQIDDAGKPKWDPIFNAKLNEESLSLGYALRWGGNFKSLGDSDHFEIEAGILVSSH